ncbi:hypothetical protein ABZ858_32365 [Streptomyces sp. NPDC047017]|uniref:hypothetical protein n=1 Tax=Streptomyces sp. NPDC047017 TaxID=3155024 RepID=UPI00340FE845
MRRTTLHRTTVATAAAAAALLLAGCGGQQDGKGSAGPTHGGGTATAPASPAGSTTPPPRTSGPAPASPDPTASGHPAGCAGHLQLSAADSGRTLCLAVGGELRLTLDGSKDRPWSPVRAEGATLRTGNPGIVMLPGDALAAYTAVEPGTAHLTSTRPACPAAPGRISCKALQEWTVTVKVTKP